MKFKYLVSSNSLDTRGHHTKRPLIKLEQITLDGKIFYSYGLIDSGADQTMVNIQYANVLGIDLSKSPERKMNGIAEGAVITKVANFTIKSIDLGEEITVPACFVDSKNVDILIGQEGFFDNFRIKFEKDHDTFEITKKR